MRGISLAQRAFGHVSEAPLPRDCSSLILAGTSAPVRQEMRLCGASLK